MLQTPPHKERHSRRAHTFVVQHGTMAAIATMCVVVVAALAAARSGGAGLFAGASFYIFYGVSLPCGNVAVSAGAAVWVERLPSQARMHVDCSVVRWWHRFAHVRVWGMTGVVEAQGFRTLDVRKRAASCKRMQQCFRSARSRRNYRSSGSCSILTFPMHVYAILCGS